MDAQNYENTQLAEFENRMEELINKTSGDIIISDPIWDPVTNKASVTLTKNTVHDNLQIQYQVGGKEEGKWTLGDHVTNLNYKDVVWARLWDGVTGGTPISQIINDTKDPKDANIQLSGTATGSTSSITATVTLADDESGVAILNSKWEYTEKAGELGKEESSYTNFFTTNPEPLTLSKTTPGTYYLHVLTKDQEGNKKETISPAITVLTQTSWNYGYEGRENTWTVPTTGYYNISCYGAQGSPGAGWGAEGSYTAAVLGTLRQSQALLTKGTVCTIHVGGQGNGVSASNGSNAGGWNDGGSGEWKTIGVGGTDHTYRSCGGGGSTYIKINGTKAISAAGGNGSYTRYQGNTINIGKGGGTTALNNTTGCTWQTGVLNTTTNNQNGGHGKITITFVK